MPRNNGDFHEGAGHKWVPTINEDGQRVEVSDTPTGRYTVSGKGAGSMRWSATHDGTGWEALGRRRSEVRGEADLHLRDLSKKKPEDE